MKLIVVISLLIGVAVAGRVPQSNHVTYLELAKNGGSRIISGQPAALGQFPWQVALQVRVIAGIAFCGGALISDQWVLTAAHCGKNAFSAQVGLGGIRWDGSEPTQFTLGTDEIFVHDDYNSLWLLNDICLIKLPTKVTINDYVRPVKLPGRSDAKIGANEKLTVSGWGLTSDSATTVSATLNYVEVSTISNEDCRAVYGSTITDKTICTVGIPSEKGSCSGDSGGPLVQYDANGEATHVGVVSFGHKDGCESPQPNGFTLTQGFLDWIAEQTGLDV